LKVQQFVEWLNGLAPFESAEGFDNVGFLMGDPAAEVHSVLIGMDITDAMAEEAIRLGAELIITHHPFIFHALKRIDYTGPQGRTLCRLAAKGISVIAAHTNWDKAVGGVGDSLASSLGLSNTVHADDYVLVGTLPSPMDAAQLAQHVQKALLLPPRCYPASSEVISRVAVAGGSYGEGYMAALSAGAQAYVVGEIAHHEILDATARGLTIYDAGHYATEMPGVKALYERLTVDAKKTGWPVEIHLHTQLPYAGASLALEEGFPL